MSYFAFKITRLPKRMLLYIESGVLAEIEEMYPMYKESTLYVDAFLGIRGEPFDSFGYSILATKDGEWSDEIDMKINIKPELGPLVCSYESIDMTFQTRKDITSLFIFTDTSDRIKINSVNGANEITIKGQPLVLGKTYMWYEFKEVVLATSTPRDGSDAWHSKIYFNFGRLNEWSATECLTTINKLYLGYLHESELDVFGIPVISADRSSGSTFLKKITVDGGIPNAPVNLRISETFALNNFSFAANDIVTDLITGDNYVSATLDDTGSLSAIITGTPSLYDSEENYGFNIEVELLSIDGTNNNVDPEKDLILISVYSDPQYADDFNIIDEVKLTSNAFGTASNDAIANIDNGDNISVGVDISLFYNKGTLPFTYEVIPDENNPGAAVIETTDFVNQFLITTLTGDATGFVYNFQVKITDANKIVSFKDISITVIEVGTIVVPTVTAPIAIAADELELISQQIVASNTPTSYRAENLPTGLSLNTSTGIISGSVATNGVYNATIYASNIAGESAGVGLTITIADIDTDAPVITSPDNVQSNIGDPFDYQITYTGAEPVTINVTDLPINFTYDSVHQKVIGTVANHFDSFMINITNAYGTDSMYVLVSGGGMT